MFLCENHWKFWTFSVVQLWNNSSEKCKTFSKNWRTAFWLKVPKLTTPHFLTKLFSQKPMFRQIERGVQNEPITKNGVLPVTTLLFPKILFQYKDLLQRVDLIYQLPKCPYSCFYYVLEFYLWVLFHVSILNFRCYSHETSNIQRAELNIKGEHRY